MSSYATFPHISQNLAPGSQGADVVALQQWLMANGFSIPAGATGYYGDQTKAAVAQWQQQAGFDTAGNPGYFGPRSMAFVSNQKAAPVSTPVVSTPAPVGSTPPPATPQPTPSSPLSSQSSPALSAGSMPPVFNAALQPGASGPEVTQLQNWLIQNGYNIPTGATGYYGDQTKAAVARWQQQVGLDTQGNPGYYGPLSQAFARTHGASESATTPATQQGTSQPAGAPVSSSGNPYFMGDYALVKMKGSDAVWLVDEKNKTIRPFESTQAVAAFYGRDPSTITPNEVDSAALAPGGALDGFVLLDNSYAIRSDGTAKPFVNDAANLSLRYGNTTYDRNQELAMTAGLDGFLNMLRTVDSGISQEQISKISGDKTNMAMYISALTYGGYTLGDIYKDIKRRELLNRGDSSMANVSPISTTRTRQDYAGTNEFAVAQNMPQLAPPTNIGSLDPMTLSLPLFQVPDEAFKTLIPLLNPDSPEFKQKMDEATSLIYEAQIQALSAKNEQEAAAALSNWERSKQYLERSLGLSLSNDATAAWNQLEQYKDTFTSRGLQGSGLMNEVVDDYLRQVRMVAQQKREDSVYKEEQQDFDYYTKYASPEKLRDFISQNPDKAARWGLTSENLKQYFSLDHLKTLFPNEPEQNLQAIINKYVDQNGNPYSNLYQQYATKQYDLSYDPSTGYQAWKAASVFNKALTDEEKRYATYTTPDSPFLRFNGPQPDVGAASATPTPGVSFDVSGAARTALNNLFNYNKTGTSAPTAVAASGAVPTVIPKKSPATPPQTPGTKIPPPIVPPKVVSTPPSSTPFTAPLSGLTPSWGSSITLPTLTSTQPKVDPAAGLLTGTGTTNDSIFGRVRKWFGF